MICKDNGLRNRMVHLYNKVDDAVAFEGIKEIILNIKNLFDMMEKWTRKN